MARARRGAACLQSAVTLARLLQADYPAGRRPTPTPTPTATQPGATQPATPPGTGTADTGWQPAPPPPRPLPPAKPDQLDL